MLKIRILLFFVFTTCISFFCIAQYEAPLYTSYTTKAARDKMHDRIIKYTINKNLSIPLNDSTEEKWEEAFQAIELMIYKTPFSEQKINYAFNNIETRSIDFQRSLAELAYSVYPIEFKNQVYQLFTNTSDPKLFAMCAEYLLTDKKEPVFRNNLSNIINEKFGEQALIDPVLYMLQLHIAEIKNDSQSIPKQNMQVILSRNFIPGKIIMYSIQRKSRDYPGLVIVRNANGNFITDSSGEIIHFPQLARSLTNLPGYISNGNTPQGIFLMNGFGVSMSSFIGPSANVQLSMPVETSIKKFLGDSSINDSVWALEYYKRLIPKQLQNYSPLYYSYYSGQAGRTEIIAHGTTIDPGYYLNQPWYPLTPSQGCLCTKEIWNGKRIESDQQKLVNTLLQAGGANGYCIVIEIDDKEVPVSIKDILPFLPSGSGK
ncbi:MAG TPA: hypothetical protein VGP55_14980 [Chitinophagaceae bacterium]|nr:hypothetical protein [Chitinophagaceae bacterium]